MLWLVDTSVWIDFLKGKATAPVRRLQSLLANDGAVCLTPVIYQEILQGADSGKTFSRYQDYFGSQPFIYPRHPVNTHVEAARLYFQCRKQGITIRSTIDCLIAQIAIEHDAVVIHDDRDFILMAQAAPDLKLAE